MLYNQQYHPKSFVPKLIAGKFLYNLFRFPFDKNDLLVLNYHSTPEWLLPEFEKQLQFFSSHFQFVTPEFLERFYSNDSPLESPVQKPFLLFTFDDGLKNNFKAAAILEKYQARGLYFLVPAFLKSEPLLQKDYYLKHIRKEVNFKIDTQPEDVTAMSEADIKLLLKRGHSIGCHSMTHTMHHDDEADKNVNEILKSKSDLESIFNVSITNFCAPFDSLQSTSHRQMELIRKNYNYYHSTFPGSNKRERNPFFIKRVNVECWWPIDVIKFALSGFEWKRWEPKRQKFTNEVLKS